MNVNKQAVIIIIIIPLQEVIPTFDMAVNELFFERFPDSILEFQIQVRPYNALKTRNMRNLNPEGDGRQTPHYHSLTLDTDCQGASYGIFFLIKNVLAFCT